MAGTSFSIDKDLAISIAGDLRGETARLRQYIEAFEGPLKEFCSIAAGEAPEMYQQAQIRWNDLLNEMSQVLGAGANVLENAAIAYAHADRTAAGGYGSH